MYAGVPTMAPVRVSFASPAAGDAEVDQLDLERADPAASASRQEHVRGLHVAVDDARRVGRRERARDVCRDEQTLQQRQR